MGDCEKNGLKMVLSYVHFLLIVSGLGLKDMGLPLRLLETRNIDIRMVHFKVNKWMYLRAQ